MKDYGLLNDTEIDEALDCADGGGFSGRCWDMEPKHHQVLMFRSHTYADGTSDEATLLATIIHECLHATMFVLGAAGVQFRDGGAPNEPFTYHHEWLVKKVCDAIMIWPKDKNLSTESSGQEIDKK